MQNDAEEGTSISRLIELAKTVRMNDRQRAEQRNSFVYGNTRIENDKVTKAMVEKIAEELDHPQS